MALKQNRNKRFLSIATVLTDSADEDTDDNFVLIQARGAEGMSIPYAFDLAVIGPKKRRPDPAVMVGSRASFAIKHVINEGDDDTFKFVTRHGIIETFEDTGPIDDYRSYAMRLVPAFKLTAYETRYRVFEDRTLEQVLREVLRPYPEIEINTSLMPDEGKEKIPYCVQFGETTFNFIHRLLERYGCFYRFEHELNLAREVMVIGGIGAVPPVHVEVVHIDGGDPGRGRVTGFRRTAVMATRAAKVGNFNEINPATPYRGEARIAPAYDLWGDFPPHEAEAFPVPATVPPAPRDYAQRRMRQNESGVFGATGNTRNPEFRAGRKFVVQKDLTVDEDEPDKGQAGKTFLLRTCSVFAYDHSALIDLGDRIIDILGGLVGLGGGKEDIATAAAKGLLDQVKKNVESTGKMIDWLEKKPGAENPSGLPGFISSALGTTGSAVAGAVPLLLSTVKSVKELVEALMKDTDGLSIAFDALPFDPPHLRDLMPMPGATKPVAHGPHFAMVVGPDGIDTSGRDIHVDALGRVRIRFPWDPGPDSPHDPIGKEALQTGRNTCFVRVSEGWAGERMGTQFLPRIGQEVLVGFIDGDPERPMVVGRVYNARGGTAHLPYLPASAQGKHLAVPDDLRGTETDQATRSGIRTKTTPRKPEGQSGFHMMRLDDRQGEEQFLLRSERRMDVTAFGSRYDTTRGNLHVLVGGSSSEPGKPPPGGSIFVTAGGEYDLHVGKDQFESIDSAINITVTADKVQDVGAGWFTYATGNAVLDADEIILNAKKKITLKVGASSIVITPAAIDNDSAFYREQMGGSPSNGPVIELTAAADAAQADPGEPPDYLARLPKGGGGGRRKHTKSPQRTARIYAAKDGTLLVGKPDGRESGLRIKTDDPAFANEVVADLDRIRETPEGLKKIDDAINSDKPTVIEKAPPTDPPATGISPNHPPASVPAGQPTGRTNPDGTPETGTGMGTGSTIKYDPSAWPRAGDPASPTSAEQLEGSLDLSGQMRDGTVPPGTYNGQPAPGSTP